MRHLGVESFQLYCNFLQNDCFFLKYTLSSCNNCNMIETPNIIIIGDTVKFTVSLSDYPAPEWTAHYKIGDNAAIDAIGTDTTHSFSISSTNTAAYSDGEKQFQLYVTNATERYTLSSGFVILKNINSKTHARKVLDAINARLENRASQEQSEYEINGRRIKFISHDELLKLRSFYLREVSNEDAKDRVSSGMGSGRKVMVRFK